MPLLYGLILSGGKSKRMGRDKALLEYQGVPHVQNLYNLLSTYCTKVFVSTKKNKKYYKYPVIPDFYAFNSPLNGIASAIRIYPQYTWLVVACDMPFVSDKAIAMLINNRSNSVKVVCYRNEEDIIEPLLSIWEQDIDKSLENYIKKGRQSPSSFIKKLHNKRIIQPNDFQWIININTKKEYDSIQN